MSCGWARMETASLRLPSWSGWPGTLSGSLSSLRSRPRLLFHSRVITIGTTGGPQSRPRFCKRGTSTGGHCSCVPRPSEAFLNAAVVLRTYVYEKEVITWAMTSLHSACLALISIHGMSDHKWTRCYEIRKAFLAATFPTVAELRQEGPLMRGFLIKTTGQVGDFLNLWLETGGPRSVPELLEYLLQSCDGGLGGHRCHLRTRWGVSPIPSSGSTWSLTSRRRQLRCIGPWISSRGSLSWALRTTSIGVILSNPISGCGLRCVHKSRSRSLGRNPWRSSRRRPRWSPSPRLHHRQGTRGSHRPAGHLRQEPPGGDPRACGYQRGAEPVHLQFRAEGFIGRGERGGDPDFRDNLPLGM